MNITRNTISRADREVPPPSGGVGETAAWEVWIEDSDMVELPDRVGSVAGGYRHCRDFAGAFP
jgi:hypothetical protein